MTIHNCPRFRDAGPRLFEAGFQPIPVNGKRPVVKDWQGMSLHEDQISFWADGDKGALNVGVRTDDLVAIDIDIYRATVAEEVEAAVRARFGDTIKRVGEAPKRLLLYAAKKPGTKITSPWYRTVDGLEHRVEVLGIGQQFVAHGIHPDTLRPYTWPDGDILDTERWMLPVVDRDEVAEWVRTELRHLLVVRGFVPDAAGTSSSSGAAGAPSADPDDAFDAVKPRHDDVGLEDLRWMLDQLPANYCDDRDSWRDAIFAVHHQFHDTEEEEDALEALIAWSQRSTKYTEGCVEPIWRKASEQRVGARGPATIGTLKAWLGDAWKTRRAQTMAVAGAAASAGWKARIEASDEAALRGALAVEIRAGQIDSLTRAAIDKLYQQRLRTLLGVAIPIGEVRRMLAPLRPLQESADQVPVDSPFFLGPDWAKPWVWSRTGDCYIHRVTKEECSITSFNAEHQRFAEDLVVEEGDDSVRYTPHSRMTMHWAVPVVSGVMFYPPARDALALIDFEGLKYLNTFRPDLVVKPDTAVTDTGQALRRALDRQLSILIPDARERDLFRYWLAHNYLFPGVKIRWAPAISGAQGDGKSIFGDLLRRLLGLGNVKTVAGDTVLKSDFTDWAEGACVNVLEEVRFQGENRFEIENRVKPFITNDVVPIHPKGKAARTVMNVTNYMVLSNHKDMLPINEGDRRYFILHSPFETIEGMDSELRRQFGISYVDHFEEIHHLVGLAPGQLARWLADSPRPEDFNPNGKAPTTEARSITIRASRESEAGDSIAQIISGGAAGVLDREALRAVQAWREAADRFNETAGAADLEAMCRARRAAEAAVIAADWPPLPEVGAPPADEAEFVHVRKQQGVCPLIEGIGPYVLAFDVLKRQIESTSRRTPTTRAIHEALRDAGFAPLPDRSRADRSRKVRWRGSRPGVWVRIGMEQITDEDVRSELDRTREDSFD